MMEPLTRRAWLSTAAAGLLAPLVGCAGYQIGNRTLYQPDIQTVYVPMFRSASFRPQMGERLTEAVVKEIELKTPYKVVGPDRADSTLQGRILGDSKTVIVENAYDEPRELDVAVRVQVAWINHRGQLIHPEQSIPVPAELVLVTQSSNFVPEVGQSLATQQQQSINRLAEQIVAMMETPW